jgi:hypothetical protein
MKSCSPISTRKLNKNNPLRSKPTRGESPGRINLHKAGVLSGPVTGACGYFFLAIGAATDCLNVVLGCFFAYADETNLPVSEERKTVIFFAFALDFVAMGFTSLGIVSL